MAGPHHYIPDAATFKAAAVGGLTSAVLVILLQSVILKFSAVVFQKYAIYGSFASIPIFLFWLHLNWTILLFGAEFAFAIQNRNTYAEEQAAVRASVVSKLWVAFSVMQEAVRVFQGSEAVVKTVAHARENNIPIRLMNEVVEVLSRASLLSPVSAEGQEGYVLLQAPENVTAKKIYDLMITDGSSPEDLGLVRDLVTDEMLNTMDVTLDETLDPITMRKFF
jgi:membrane protein